MFELPLKSLDRLSANKVSIVLRFAFTALLFLMANTFGQAQTANFQDGFSDGNFSHNPVWSGDTTGFTVNNISGNYQLQLQGDKQNGGTSYLSTPSANTVGAWEFYINLDGFSPSDGNRAEIILMSDTPDLKGTFNGYALQAGENGRNDVFRIVKYTNGSASSVVLSGTTDISSGGDYRVKIIREADGTWELYVADSYAGLALREGESRIDDTFTEGSYFGLLVTYTATRYNRFFFDFKIDLPPFDIRNVSGSENWIEVTFNRSYDAATVQVSDFSFNNGLGFPVSLNFIASNAIRLNYSSTIKSNRYTLTLNNITDEQGESIPTDTDFEFIIYGIPGPRDVVINEFMYDPPIGMPEYVELKNISGEYLNLMGWQLGDQSGLGNISNDTLVFEPEELLVISTDTAALINTFGPGNYVSISSGNFPSLNNGGDAIRIRNNKGILLDSLFYDPEWGGEDIALERRSESAASDKRANWGDSPHGIGTPGLPNVIEMDFKPPTFKSLQILSPKTLLLIFDEQLNQITATEVSNYSISPDTRIQLVSAVDDTVYLALAEELQSLQTYRVTVTGLQDIFGNTMAAQTKELRYIKFGEVKPGDIVINEILFDEVENGSPEFIELINTTDKNFNLSDWLLGDASNTARLPFGTDLLAEGHLVLTGNFAFAGIYANAQYISEMPSLNNSEDIVYLRTSENATIDSLKYTSKWIYRKPGLSMERKDPSAASNDPSNWETSTAEQGHTVGITNSVYMPDEIPPEIIFARRLSPELIKVQFSEFVILNTDLTFNSNNAALNIEHFDVSNGGSMILRTSSSKFKSVSESLQARNLTDVRGNVSAIQDISIAQELKPGDVVINEIMYNPLTDPADNLPDQSEYIELRNLRDYAVSLEGISLHDAPDENSAIRHLIPVNTDYKWLAPHGLALIYSDEQDLFEESSIARFFELSEEQIVHFRIDRSSLSLDSDDAIFLAGDSGKTIDSVYYSGTWHNPNLADTRGIALERVNPEGPSNEAANWSSNTLLKGGTPGSENSIFQLTNNQPETSGITFSPNPFSPDDDGTDDRLVINYKLDEPDYLLKVTIYDKYGRLIRKLADGQPAGFEGSLMWDGRNNEGKSNRIGIYIVVFEARNSVAGSDKAYKKTAVLARRLN